MKTNSTVIKTLKVIAGTAILLIVLLLTLGCAERATEAVVTANNGTDGKDGINGSSCYVEESEYGTKLSCTDGSFAVISNGKDGSSCSIEETEDGAVILCGDESVATLYNGTSGQDGQSCSVQDTRDGAIITCRSSTSTITNGESCEQDNTPLASIKTYISSSCTSITGTTNYVKVGNNNISIYSSSNCSSNTKMAEVSQGEAYWVSSNSLATYSSGALRVITFN